MAINVLPEALIRKIAAGEVIERPSSVLRELLDNSLDAGASNIEIWLEEGGMRLLCVIDDGCGMNRQDLEKSWLAHSTSKISDPRDLICIKTLGFRGEALSSIAACSRLSIQSISKDQNEAWNLIVEDGQQKTLEPSSWFKGTRIEVRDLFFSYPARKRFLKNAQSELRSSLSVWEEKALAYPQLSFKVFSEKQAKFNLSPQSRLDRLKSIYKSSLENFQFVELNGKNGPVHWEILYSTANHRRKDRKFIKVFINGRLVNETSLIQSMLRAFAYVLPGGYYPLCFLFLKIDPTYVDFNVHPAKKDVKLHRLEDLPAWIYRHIRESLQKGTLTSENISQQNLEVFPQSSPLVKSQEHHKINPRQTRKSLKDPSSYREPLSSNLSSQRQGLKQTLEILQDKDVSEGTQRTDKLFQYYGQYQKKYLIVEYQEELYLIDQHAAHEKLLFESFKQKNIPQQDLLIPLALHFQRDNYLTKEDLSHYKELGIVIEQLSSQDYTIRSLPAYLLHHQDSLISFIQNTLSSQTQEFENHFFAQMACKQAIKSGENLASGIAETIIREIFQNRHEHCPHGRPLWVRFKLENLDSLVKRT